MTKNQTPFNIDEVLKRFEAFASSKLAEEKKDPGYKFVFTKQSLPAIRKVLTYMANEPGELDLSKGIMLQGPVGTGKSTLMRLLSMWLVNKPRAFRMVNCRDIQRQAAKDGFEALYKYSKHSYQYNNGYHRDNGPVTYCFDDFGAEKVSKFYGTEINVMEELMQDRYNEFDQTRMLTHGTTNIKDGDVYEEKYGPRVRDRLREMFNFVELNGPTFRK